MHNDEVFLCKKTWDGLQVEEVQIENKNWKTMKKSDDY